MARRGTKQRAFVELPDGTEYEVTFGIPEIVAWEKSNKGAGFYDASGEIRFERQAWVIWSASRKAGHTDKRFDEWLQSISDCGLILPDEKSEDDDDASDPTDGSTPES